MLKEFYFIVVISSLLIFLNSCGSEPEPIDYGHDECEFCRMQITDNKYGAEIVTVTGKVYKFDSIECLVDFALLKNMIGDQENNLLITDYSNPESFIDARKAFYLHNDEFRSPMGLNVMAFGGKSYLDNFVSENGGEPLSWVEVIELVKQRSM